MHSKKFSRRQFLKASAIAAASAAAAPLITGCETACSCYMRPFPTNAIGANGDIRVAVIGFNSRGKDHLKGLRELKGVRVVALCDVDTDVLDREVAESKKLNEKVTPYQ